MQLDRIVRDKDTKISTVSENIKEVDRNIDGFNRTK